MNARTDLVARLADLVGPSLVIEDLQNGWPTLAILEVDGEWIPVALFVSTVGLSHRGRDDVERRFQNPSGDAPLIHVPDRHSVLLGVWEYDPLLHLPGPLLVTADANRRADGRTTRWSVFAPLATLDEALTTGWATHVSDSDEQIRCIHPALLSAGIAADLAWSEPSGPLVRTAISASGLLDDPANDPNSPAAERARRAASSLVRDARFSRRVLAEYDYFCAMCGLGLGLVQGAHIYPAAAPGSEDEPWNGLALCGTHHLAFDSHIIAVLPDTMEVVFHADVIANATYDPAAQRLIEGTFVVLGPARRIGPDPEMFLRRYDYFEAKYDWLWDT